MERIEQHPILSIETAETIHITVDGRILDR